MRVKKESRLVFMAALATFLLLISTHQTMAQGWPKAVAIAAGRPGSGVYNTATGMASVITKYLKVKASAESGLFGKNIVLLHNGDVEFGMAQADLGYDAARGLGDYKKYGPMKLKFMFSAYTSPAAFVVRADSGIESVGRTIARVFIYEGMEVESVILTFSSL